MEQYSLLIPTLSMLAWLTASIVAITRDARDEREEKLRIEREAHARAMERSRELRDKRVN